MKNKKVIYIILAISVVGIILYFLLRKRPDGTTLIGDLKNKIIVSVNPYNSCFGETRDWLKMPLPLEEDIHDFPTPDCLKTEMDKICGDAWKCRKMLKAGAYIPTDYKRNHCTDVSDERLLSWAYELYYLSGKDWAEREDRYKLLSQAEYQACINK